MKKLILAAALAAVAFPAFAEAPKQNVSPAMWAVKDKDTTVYLFGTVHALDGKQDWFNDEVKSAYDKSQEVVFEALMPEASEIPARVMPLAIDRSGKTLSSRLKPDTARLLAAQLAEMGAPATAFDQFEPWFASMALSAVLMQKLGMKPETGVEEILEAAAKKDGKTLGEVESFNWQMNLFDTMPEEMQLAMLASGLEDMAEAEKVMGEMVGTWSKGDIDSLAKLMNEAMIETPELGKLLLADRNARWAEWIDKRLDKPGTVFMAVGAGHLGGSESVQAMLAKRGIKSERVKSR